MRYGLLAILASCAAVGHGRTAGKVVPVMFLFSRAVSAPDAGVGVNGGFNQTKKMLPFM